MPIAALATGLLLLAAPGAGADQLPDGFFEQTVLEGLNQPVAIQFAPDGRIFVAEKEGKIKVFHRLRDPSPETYVDMRREVNAFLDRGLLGLALSPDFATDETVYIAYTHDAPIGDTAPTYGAAGDPGNPDDDWLDYCVDACEVSGRVSRLTPDGANPPDEEVLIEDWCQQWGSHSIGALEFDPHGRLYVSGGEGANFNQEDFGQTFVLTHPDQPYHPIDNPYLSPPNACGDPGSAEGELPANPATAEGGALRSQDLETASDPLSLSGTIARIDPSTPAAAGVPENPLYNAGAPASNASRIIASGLRNPFRFAIAPSGEVWLGDVGWRTWEELNSFDPDGATVPNFGWPCYEGNARTEGYKDLGLGICTDLYNETPASVKPPEFTYDHRDFLYAGDPCPVPGGGSSTSGVEFYTGDAFPAEYDNALFFADYARQCIWVMRETAGEPDPATIQAFDQNLIAPVDLEVGPDGGLYYVDIGLGQVRRIQHSDGNQPPVAVAEADPENPAVDANVQFDATASTDADASDVLSYAWDLDGDEEFDDSTDPQPIESYSSPGPVSVSLRVTDGNGGSDEATVQVSVGHAPVPVITGPAPGSQWETGQILALRGAGTDTEDAPGDLDLAWEVDLNHCLPGGDPGTGCHVHSLPDAFGASYDVLGPEHEYPAKLTVRLTATDSDGLSSTVEQEYLPRTVDLQVQSQPAGATLGINGAPATGARTLIKNSPTSVSATSPQTLNSQPHDWCGWSDGGAQSHSFPATASMTLTATFCRNHPPTDISLSNSEVAENRPAGETVGSLETAAPDSDPHTLALVPGAGSADNGFFEIVGSTLKTTASLDHEVKSSRQIRVSSEDDHDQAVERALTITVEDVNEAPSDLSLSPATIKENQPPGSTVGNLSATDEDDSDTHTYELVSGAGSDDNSSFEVVGSTLRTTATFDHESRTAYEVRVEAADGRDLRFSKTLTIAISDANDPPTDLELSGSSINENQPPGTEVGTFGADDDDTGDAASYVLAEGAGDTDNDRFSIDGNALVTAAGFDFETESDLSIRVRARDGSDASVERAFAIAVADVDDPPIDLALSNATVEEAQMIGTQVGTFSAADEDADSLEFALVRGPGDDDNSNFRVSGSTLETAQTLDYRDGATRNIRVQVDDGRGGTMERALEIEVLATQPRIERLKLKIPRKASRLAKKGAKALVLCAVDCEAVIKLVGRGRTARKAKLRGRIGRTRASLQANSEQLVIVRPDKRSQRRLKALEGNRSPRVSIRTKAWPAAG